MRYLALLATAYASTGGKPRKDLPPLFLAVKPMSVDEKNRAIRARAVAEAKK